MASEAQRKAIQKYKQKVKRIQLEFSPAESEMWEHIQSQENKQGYIKSLIRKDMLVIHPKAYSEGDMKKKMLRELRPNDIILTSENVDEE